MARQTIPVQSGYRKNRRKTERRNSARFPNDQEIWYQQVSASSKYESNTAWLGRVRDVSLAGIGLSMSQLFEPGAALIIELAASPRVLGPMLLHVVHATPEANGRWIIGCTFDCALSQEELQIVLGE